MTSLSKNKSQNTQQLDLFADMRNENKQNQSLEASERNSTENVPILLDERKVLKKSSTTKIFNLNKENESEHSVDVSASH